MKEYCAFSPGLRGPRADARRVSREARLVRRRPLARPAAATARVYDGDCQAAAAGVDLAVTGGCTTVLPDWAPCGPLVCDVRTSYSVIDLSDVFFEIPTTYNCRALPAACRPAADGGAPPPCDCFPASTPCRTFCGPLPTGGPYGLRTSPARA